MPHEGNEICMIQSQYGDLRSAAHVDAYFEVCATESQVTLELKKRISDKLEAAE